MHMRELQVCRLFVRHTPTQQRRYASSTNAVCVCVQQRRADNRRFKCFAVTPGFVLTNIFRPPLFLRPLFWLLARSPTCGVQVYSQSVSPSVSQSVSSLSLSLSLSLSRFISLSHTHAPSIQAIAAPASFFHAGTVEVPASACLRRKGVRAGLRRRRCRSTFEDAYTLTVERALTGDQDGRHGRSAQRGYV